MNDWMDAEHRVEKAHELYESGRWEDAAKELRAAIRVNPYQGEWHFNLGLTLEAMGQFDQAIRSFEQALTCEDGDAYEVLMMLGVNCARLERYDQALAYLQRGEQLRPEEPASYAHRIEVYADLEEHDLAEQMYYQAIQADESCVKAYLNISRSLSSRQMHDRALWCLERARQIDPSQDQLLTRLAEAHWAKGETDRACQWYLQHLRQYPGDADALLDLGALLVEMRRPAEAAEKYRRVIELEPGHGEAYFLLGELQMRYGQMSTARQSFNACLKCEPTRPEAHQKLARIALSHDRQDLARTHLNAELALTDADRSDRACEELGQLLLETDMALEASGVFEPLARKYPDQPRLIHQWAVSRLMVGELREGARLCRRTLRLDPNHRLALFNLALVCLQMGWWRRASVIVRHGRRTDPGDRRFRRLSRRLRWARVRAWLGW